jgi:hypothetical protein
MEEPQQPGLSFFGRFGVALACFRRASSDSAFCRRIAPLLSATEPSLPPKKVEVPPERVHASGLFILSMLQREGRLIDFLQEDVASFSDADVGSAARVVHAGCRKALDQCLTLEPIRKEAEGASVALPAGFDAQRVRLTGNISGQPPFRGALKHHGWVAASVRLPALSETLDPRVLAPAEVELP